MSKSLLSLILPAALGTLTLTTTASAVTSAELYRTVPEGYGKFEARLQFAGGDGVVGSYFLWKDASEMEDVFWNELDFEKVGAACDLQTNSFYGLPEKVHVGEGYGLTGLCEGYHTYAYEWTPDYIAWFVDGTEIRRDTGEDALAYAENATEGMQFRFNVWPGDASFGGTFSESILPIYEFVSWAQYSQYTPGAGDEGSDFTLSWREEFDALPADWATATWDSPKGLSVHSSQNVNFVDGIAVLSLTMDDATGFVGTPPADGPASSTGGSDSTGAGGTDPMGASSGGTDPMGASSGGTDPMGQPAESGSGCSYGPVRSRVFPMGMIAGLMLAAAFAFRRLQSCKREC
jgi:hypothetical protein